MGRSVDRHRVLAHGFEERRLALRTGPVDLVGEQDVREHGPRLEDESVGGVAVLHFRNGEAREVARKQVAGELNTTELRLDGPLSLG